MAEYTVRIDADGNIHSGDDVINISKMVTMDNNKIYDINDNLLLDISTVATTSDITDITGSLSTIGSVNDAITSLQTDLTELEKPATLISKLLTVDGDGSGLDADKVKGNDIDVYTVSSYVGSNRVNRVDTTLLNNLNSYVETGFYTVSISTATNVPGAILNSSDYGSLTVERVNSGDALVYVNQSLTVLKEDAVWARRCQNSVWSNWYKVRTSSDETVSSGAPSGGVDGDIWYQV